LAETTKFIRAPAVGANTDKPTAIRFFDLVVLQLFLSFVVCCVRQSQCSVNPPLALAAKTKTTPAQQVR
jgi:hypothetical protein